MNDSRSDIKRSILGLGSFEPDSVSMRGLSVVLLGMSENRRRTLAQALSGTQAQVAKEAGLVDRDMLPTLLDADCDVLIVDLDQDTERALNLVEAACGFAPNCTVMIYSRLVDRDLLVRCMQVGAREFLNDPLTPAAVTEALVRASVRKEELKRQKKIGGKCLVFIGAKGGSGTTTLAANFALALAKASGLKVVLADLDLQLGDAALSLGISGEFSTLDALEHENRLDSILLAKLLAQHNSGLQVLAAPDEHSTFQPPASSVMKLIGILREDFAYVVVDAGSHYGSYGQELFDLAEKVYLVTQVSVVELRNSHRLISSHFKGESKRKLEVVLNRFVPRAGEIDEETIAKALTVTPQWKIPSDYQAVRRAQNAAQPLVEKDGAITRVINQMANTACGRIDDGKKRKYSIFG